MQLISPQPSILHLLMPVFCNPFTFSHGWKSFWQCPTGWEETTIFWVAVEPFFLPTWSQECYVKSILVTGLLFPIHHCQFWLPGCFSSMARTCNCGVCFCCLVWTSWEGKWGLTSLINTVWEGTSHTYLGVFSSSLHTLNTTGREGIAWGTV